MNENTMTATEEEIKKAILQFDWDSVQGLIDDKPLECEVLVTKFHTCIGMKWVRNGWDK